MDLIRIYELNGSGLIPGKIQERPYSFHFVCTKIPTTFEYAGDYKADNTRLNLPLARLPPFAAGVPRQALCAYRHETMRNTSALYALIVE
jgi:hypothetical protein